MCQTLLGRAAQRLVADNFVSETALTFRQVNRTVRILAVGETLRLLPFRLAVLCHRNCHCCRDLGPLDLLERLSGDKLSAC